MNGEQGAGSGEQTAGMSNGGVRCHGWFVYSQSFACL